MILTEEQVIAAAGVDPRALQALLAAGRPDAIVALSRAFEEAGRSSVEAYRRGARAHQVIGGSFTNDGAPVLDVAAQDARAGRNLGDAGQDLTDAAGLLRRAVPALEGAQQVGARAVTGMQTDLRDLLTRWDRFVASSAATGGVTAADRATVMAAGVGIVRTAATTVGNATDEYDAGLRRDAAELRGRGYVEDAATLAANLSRVPAVVGDVVRNGVTEELLTALGVPVGVVTAALAAKGSANLLVRTKTLAQFVGYATRTAADPTRALLDARLAERALENFKTGFPLPGAHAARGALGTVLRGLQESRVARLAGSAALPLTVASAFLDVATGGGYQGARGIATRAIGGAAALGAGALVLGVTAPVGVAVAGAAVLGYEAWSIGNAVYDHRAEIARSFDAAKGWAGRALSGIGAFVDRHPPPLPSTVPVGVL